MHNEYYCYQYPTEQLLLLKLLKKFMLVLSVVVYLAAKWTNTTLGRMICLTVSYPYAINSRVS